MKPVRSVLLMDLNIEDPLERNERHAEPDSLLRVTHLYGHERRPVFSDFALWLIAALWLATVVGFLTGLLPYPFGIIVLSILFVVRVLSLKLHR